jgi:TusA-related sulfurtransferase
MTTQAQPNITLDMKGTSCPGPILGAKRLVDEMEAGQILLLISDCPGTHDDVFSWTKYTDVEVVKTEKMSAGGTGYYIRKGKTKHLAPNAVLDIRGVHCPGPIVEAKKLLNGMSKGEILELWSNCPGIRADIDGWIKATGFELVDTRESAAGEYQFYIRKTK